MSDREEIDKLKQDVNDLKILVKYLAQAVDSESENVGVLSDTVHELVQTERENITIQAKVFETLQDHSQKLDNVENGITGIQDMLHGFLPSPDKEEE